MSDRKAILSTKRCDLFELEVCDASHFYQMNLDPEVLQYTGDVPFKSVPECEQFIASYDQYQRYGYGRWSVYEKTTDQYLGFCGLKYSPQKQEVDIGFRFIRSAWGRGLATETARAVLNYGFNQIGIATIVGRAMEENLASIRVLQKLGMKKRFHFIEAGKRWVQMDCTNAMFCQSADLLT